jgi:enterochelin esterase-like enzyme
MNPARMPAAPRETVVSVLTPQPEQNPRLPVPQDWISVLGITTILLNLLHTGQAKPVVLVMPDASGGRGISLQCLNQVRGPQDATYLARDLPAVISRIMRVQPPGPAWGIAGYSEGGFCAANIGLHYGQFFGYAGVLSGYFRPLDNRLGSPPAQSARLAATHGFAARTRPMTSSGRCLPARRSRDSGLARVPGPPRTSGMPASSTSSCRSASPG